VSDLTIDLNTLAQETLELSENIRKEFLKRKKNGQGDLFSFDDFQGDEIDHLLQERHDNHKAPDEMSEDAFDFSNPTEFSEQSVQHAFEVEESREENLGPQGPGLLYRIDKGISTFCLRGLASEDLMWDIEAIERQDVDVMRSLKINEEEQIQEVRFFETDDYPMAETIVDQMINRRFPRQESMLCNLSDPGFSWWMDEGHGKFAIYFQSHGIERDSSLVQLGPLGDPMIAYRRLGRALSVLRRFFPINEYGVTEKVFEISTTNASHQGYEAFANIFLHGEFPFQEILSELTGEEHTLFLYLREVAALRRFWLTVQKRSSIVRKI
jgi:hypothetical protein